MQSPCVKPRAELSVSLRDAPPVAKDAVQVVLMVDDLSQLKVLWEMARGFEERLDANAGQAKEFGSLAAAGLFGLPKENRDGSPNAHG